MVRFFFTSKLWYALIERCSGNFIFFNVPHGNSAQDVLEYFVSNSTACVDQDRKRIAGFVCLMDDEQYVNLPQSHEFYYIKYRDLGYGIIGDNPEDLSEAFKDTNRNLVEELLDSNTWAFMHHVLDVSVAFTSASEPLTQ